MKFKVGDLVVGKCGSASKYIVVGRRWWLFNWYIKVASSALQCGTWRREELFNYAPTKDRDKAWQELNNAVVTPQASSNNTVTPQVNTAQDNPNSGMNSEYYAKARREILQKLASTCDSALLTYYAKRLDHDINDF